MADMRADPSTLASPPNGCEPVSSELDRAVDVTRSLVGRWRARCRGWWSARRNPHRGRARRAASAGGSAVRERRRHHDGAERYERGDRWRSAAPTGVFYRRPEPGKPPMVAVGDRVETGQPLAIVEAMKMMNDVVASVGGTIIGIHAEDQDVVEFDELLFTIEEAA